MLLPLPLSLKWYQVVINRTIFFSFPMAGHRFEEALQKALRMVDESCTGFDPGYIKINEDVRQLINLTNTQTVSFEFVNYNHVFTVQFCLLQS